MIANRRHRAACQIEQRQVAVGHRQILRDDGGLLVRRKVGHAPTPALYFRDHPVGRWIAGIHDINVVVGAIAPGRGIGDQLVILAPCIQAVAALAVGEQVQLAVFQRVDLVKFVSADIFLRK